MLHVGLSIVAGYTEKSPLQVQYYRASISEERAEITKRHHVCFFRSYLISDKAWVASSVAILKMKALFHFVLFLAFVEFSNSENPENSIFEKVLQELKEIRNELKDTKMKLKAAELKLENSEKKLGKVPDDLESRLEHLEEVTKANVPRTCDDLFYYGVQKSGLYRIDPGKFLRNFRIFSFLKSFYSRWRPDWSTSNRSLL